MDEASSTTDILAQVTETSLSTNAEIQSEEVTGTTLDLQSVGTFS